MYNNLLQTVFYYDWPSYNAFIIILYLRYRDGN